MPFKKLYVPKLKNVNKRSNIFILYIINIEFFYFFNFIYIYTHTYMGEGDEIRKYTHTSTPKLHATVSVAEQVINFFSISHLTDVG